MLFCPFCGEPIVIPEQDAKEAAAPETKPEPIAQTLPVEETAVPEPDEPVPEDARSSEEAIAVPPSGESDAAEELLNLCGETAALLGQLREEASPLLLSDVGCAAASCRAALLSACYNVYVNTASYPEDGEAQRLNRLAERALQESLPCLEAVEQQVLQELRCEKT